MNQFCSAADKYKELEDYIEGLEEKKNSLIAVLHKAQEIFGYLSQDVQFFIGEKLDIPVSKIYGVITFYSFFATEPRGKYVINVCMGTACFVRGAKEVLKEVEQELGIKAGETTEDELFTIDVLRCIGACGLAPVVTVNDKVYGNVTKNDIPKIIAEALQKEVINNG